MTETVATAVGRPGRALVRSTATRVPGRVRFDVPGLYRSDAVRARLEQALGDLDGVRSVQPNVLTGRVLVLFAPTLALDALSAAIERAIDERAPSPRALPRAPRRWPVVDALRGFTGAFRGFASMLRPSEALASMAGAQTMTAGRIKETQAILPWHRLTLDEVIGQLGSSDQQGLAVSEAGERLRRYGLNTLVGDEGRSDIAIFIDQFNSLPVWLLCASAGIAVITGGLLDAGVILGVVLINGVIGFVTERQAEKTINSLAETGVREVQVLRDGEAMSIEIEQIVPGDVLLLTPGSYLAADVRLMRSHRLTIDESALTGESLPVTKDHDFKAVEETALGDRKNMGYMGTHVTGGNGRGVVVATAEATELGQIQTMVGEAESPDTPMQRQLDQMGTQLALLSGAICAGVFVVGVLRGYAWLEMLKSSVSLAVAAVPEGLPAVATTTLAMGIADMRKRNVAVRHLDAVETLGSVQVFCMDKTGTLTMNRMAVVSVYGGGSQLGVAEKRFVEDGKTIDALDREELVRMLQVVALCSEVEVLGPPGSYTLEGSATESALVQMGLDAGIDVPSLRNELPKLKTRYRAEGRPYMSTLHATEDGKGLLAVKGSPDAVLEHCTTMLRDGKKVRLNAKLRQEILRENERMAGNALRVLGAAYRDLDSPDLPPKTEKLVWLGLSGMADPMRPGMDKLIREWHRAGIQTIMITGDQAATAYAIGKQLGLSGNRPLQVLESSKLDEMEPELLAGLAKNVQVFARVSPAHKLKIVRALQEAGYVVAMTGDGINDGPALKASDIGVAMGMTGTNVARDVSDVVLEDDNLHTMETAVSQGRTIYNNIRKMIHFMVSTNLTEIEVMLAGVAMGWGQAMNPMQLLWINLVTDIFPGLALSLEPAEPGIMDLPPRDPDEAIIEGHDLKRMIFESGIIGVGTLGAFIYGMRRYGLGPAASTLAFNTLTLNELVHALSSRSHYRLVGGRELPSNPHLTKAVVGMAALQLIVSVLPGARRLLGTSPLGLADLAVVGAGVLGPLVINEATKPGWKPHEVDQDPVDALPQQEKSS